MNIKILLAVFTCCAYIKAEESFKVYRNLGKQSIFEKKNVTDYHESKVEDYDFEKNALIFRGFGADPNWGELPVLRITCFRVINNGNHEIDELTFFRVIPARPLHSMVKHELSTHKFIPLDMPVKPSSVIFRVVPREYRGTINNGVLIEGASYVFARRHRNIEFMDMFTVPIGLKGNTVTTFHWNIERKKDKIEKNQPTSVNLTFGNEIDFSSDYTALYVAVENGAVSRFHFNKNQKQETILLNRLGGDLLLTSLEKTNHHWMYIRDLQDTNVRMPDDADIVLTSDNGVQIKFEVLAAPEGSLGLEVYAHEKSIIPLVYETKKSKSDEENVTVFNFILPKGEYIYKVFNIEKKKYINQGLFSVQMNTVNPITVNLLED